MIEDAASLSVMIESIGCRTSRWRQMTRYEFISLETSKRGPENLPCCTKRQKSRLQHAISSLSSSSDSSNPASSIVTRDNDDSSPGRVEKVQTPNEGAMIGPETETNRSFTDVQSKHVQNIIASIGGSVVSSGNAVGSSENKSKRRDATEFFHDYHAKPLPDPKISDFDRSNESSPSEDDPADDPNRSSMADRKRPIGSDLLMGCDYEPTEPRAVKRRKTDSVSNECPSQRLKVMFSQGTTTSIYPNIARMGGIRHSIGSSHSAVEAPPVLTGVGKRHGSVPSAAGSSSLLTGAGALRERSTTLAADFCSQHDSNDNTNVAVDAASNPCHIDLDTNSSGNEVSRGPQIRARYHLNEDDMIMMGGVLMGPFVFRSQDAVLRGAVSECAMPGMVRAYFSAQNKLQSLEMLYDALGFMQQLERANGHESVPHIIPGCLEMALAPNCNEARVITLANPPYLIVNVNEVWTRTTGYTQNDVEGIAYLTLLEGESTVLETKAKHRKPIHLLEEVAQGRPACSTNIHYDRDGRDFIEFICSFPLTNNDDEVTHILHVSQELPSFRE